MDLSSIVSTCQNMVNNNQKDEALQYLHCYHETIMQSDIKTKEENSILCSLCMLYLSLGDMVNALSVCDKTILSMKRAKGYSKKDLLNVEYLRVHMLLMLKSYEDALNKLLDMWECYQEEISLETKSKIDLMEFIAGIYTDLQKYEESTFWYQKCIDFTETVYHFYTKPSKEYTSCYDEEVADILSHLYLALGKDQERLGNREKAITTYEMGYYISYNAFGMKDERTLKFDYFLTVINMKGINIIEDWRQISSFFSICFECLGMNNDLSKLAKQKMDSVLFSPIKTHDGIAKKPVNNKIVKNVSKVEIDTKYKSKEDKSQNYNENSFADMLLHKGDELCQQGDINNAITAYVNAREYYNKEHDNVGVADAWFSIGKLLAFTVGDYIMSLPSFEAAAKIYSEENEVLKYADACFDKGKVLDLLGVTDKAIDELNKAEQLYRQYCEKRNLAKVLFYKGELLRQKLKKEYMEEALVAYSEVEKIYKEEQLYDQSTYYLLPQCYIYIALGQLDKAKKLLCEAEGKILNGNSIVEKADYYSTKACLHKRMGEMNEAVNALDIAEGLFRNIEDGQGIADTIQLKGDLLWEEKDYNNAMICYQEALTQYQQLRNTGQVLTILQKMQRCGL